MGSRNTHHKITPTISICFSFTTKSWGVWAGLRQKLVLYQAYYNFCLPHAGLRQALPQPEPTHGTGSARQWRPCTPAMAAGLTDRVWTLREVLLFRVPPWPQPAEV